MYYNKSLSRELSLISLGLIKDKGNLKLTKIQIENIFESALDSLINHCRDELDNCEIDLENASQKILDSELQEGSNSSFSNVRDELKKSLKKIETVMNTLSLTLDFPKLIVSSGQIDIREDVNKRISKIINNLATIDSDIDQVMDGWRLKRLPRVDRDILRLAFVDINFLDTPIAVACDEAVNLANKYSDVQGRKFINGVLRRLQTVKLQ
ncbi:Transcription termination protein NusB [Prochlorococcus marinus str. MIT 9321]|uniref:Transcription termination protein NusB n=1 Tax=Prochlorococcus marinus str. MIT 9401 TaxID=167551 RepID=A0A0A2B0I3_PROMR|nr:transcription antitermination factor NusB [Prochlorococcus marinus]KGG03297.1 Transcription termination protein NusB [Prochlorococcus marinus str. MIT 9321]KGG06079.1 Transcription termination protein NusB [Prochlorococcus marinus str. MIT 9322]KGG06652.1 Transcription termination protein NusB [Prochlorococcus marinus str. MIT 9401]